MIALKCGGAGTTIYTRLAPLWGIIGTLAGVIVGWLLNARSQRKVWLANSKKEEWRELLSTLERCQQKIKRVKAATPGDTNMLAYDEVAEGQLEGARVIQNRVVILETLQNNHVKEDWQEIVNLSKKGGWKIARPEDAFSETEFIKLWAALHSKLVGLARKDLKL